MQNLKPQVSGLKLQSQVPSFKGRTVLSIVYQVFVILFPFFYWNLRFGALNLGLLIYDHPSKARAS